MTADPRPSARWKPALLSGLVFPGLGQLTTGHPWRALFFGASSLALIVSVVARVTRETQRLMPVDPGALLDPALPFRLAVEIHRANASFFFWCTLGIVALWAGAIMDAGLPRASIRTAPGQSDPRRHALDRRRPPDEG